VHHQLRLPLALPRSHVRLDLHIHSSASDGAWSPEAVVRGARSGGLDVIALADHDTVGGFAEADRIGKEIDLQVVPALEVSSTYRGGDIHVLGYFVDPDAPSLAAHTERAGRRRQERMLEILERLRAQGIQLTYQAVERAAGPAREVIGRPHLAKALVAAGYASSVPDAFDRLIGDRHRAFVPTELLEPVGAVEVVRAAGGVPIWAHPPGDLLDELLPQMMRAGLRGLEVWRPRNHATDVLRYEEVCRTSSLLMSGGSDWHTPDGGSVLGDFFVGGEDVEGLLAAGGM
jgi:predicted metal-dependent phosphoesterase TrpH